MTHNQSSCLKIGEYYKLKWDRDADTAIRQIKEKRYTGSLRGYQGDIYLVGITYDKATKHHTCKIEVV